MSSSHWPSGAMGERGRLAAEIAASVDRIGGVRRYAGSGVEIATQHAGGRVVGVTISDAEVGVHVALSRFPLDRVSAEVRLAALQALDRLGDSRPVAVYVDDIDLDRDEGEKSP